jgi:hypothetical protein
MHRMFRLSAVMVCVFLILGAQPLLRPVAAQSTLPDANSLDPAILQKWMELLYDRIEAEAIDAPAASRLYAYAGVTGYQAVQPGIPEGITMAGQVNDLPDTPTPEPGEAIDWISAANAALSTVIASFFPEDAAETQQMITQLRESQIRTRSNQIDAAVVEASTTYGDSVAQVILEWISTDGYIEAQMISAEYEPPTGDPSFWVPTEDGMRAVEPYWGRIRPFALYDVDSCWQNFNITFDTTPGSTFYLQAMETMEVGNNLTREQRDIATFWVDTPGITGTPAGHWIMIASQMVDHLDLRLGMSSMMFGLVGIAVGDSFISAWSTKYQLNLLRPESYIQTYIDENWQPFIESPGFPEYPSGHSVVSAAAAEVLTGMFGTVAFTDRSGRRHRLGERSFTSFEQAAMEAAISRIYGGIHFRAAVENGIDMGRCVGENVLEYVTLRSTPQGE